MCWNFSRSNLSKYKKKIVILPQDEWVTLPIRVAWQLPVF